MDFGKLHDISTVDFTLPPDNPFTELTLNKSSVQTSTSLSLQNSNSLSLQNSNSLSLQNSTSLSFRNRQSEIKISPPVWANKDWIGKVYPTNAKDKDFLYYYSRQFNTIELNVTHYQIPSESTIDKWREVVPKDFKFCPKFPQIISHDKMLIGTESLTDEFCTNILALGENLGTTFLQLSPTFEPKYLTRLEIFLQKLPKNFPIAVEFRNEKWFNSPKIWEETSEMLANLNIGTVITDVAGRRDVLHQTLTTPTFTLRFVGNELHKTDYERVDAWCEKIVDWVAKGLQTAYIFVHCGENTLAPELTKYWIQRLNTLGDFDIKPPIFREKVVQRSLF